MFENKKILVLGMARSGVAVAKLLAKYNNEIICRALLLNCLTKNYEDLYNSWTKENIKDYEWSKTRQL